MARLPRLVSGTFSVVALTLTAAPALADSAAGAAKAAPAQCQAEIGGQTPTGVTLPSNAPALLIIDSPYNAPTTAISAELVTEGKRTPFAAPAKDANGLNALTLPLNTVGSHTVSISTTCYGSPSPAREIPLKLTDAVPFPTSIGKLVHVPKNPPTGLDEIRLEPTAGVRAFLPATRFSLSVGGVADTRPLGSNASPDIAFSAQTGKVCVENGALHREKRTVQISVGAAIAGVAQAMPNETLDITVDCGAIKWTNASDFSDDDNGTTTTPGATPGSSSSTGGCSAVAVGAPSGIATALAALGFGTLVVLRRRRRRA